MAVKNAIDTIKSRLVEVVVSEFEKNIPNSKTLKENIVFKNNFISDKQNPERKIDSMKLINRHM